MYFVHHAAEIFTLLLGGLVATNLAFLVAWIRARERAVRAEAMLSAVRPSVPATHDLTPALDAIAFEVERIGEGQRFLTRVLSNQPQEPVSKRPPGSITPH
jgi:lipopolysaccharide export LptBFGC system permease protein LptF